MKSKAEPVIPAKPASEPRGSNRTSLPEGFRRLKWDELVSVGDFVADEHQGFTPWVGPSGFRADSFEKPIYRQGENRAPAAKKSK